MHAISEPLLSDLIQVSVRNENVCVTRQNTTPANRRLMDISSQTERHHVDGSPMQRENYRRLFCSFRNIYRLKISDVVLSLELSGIRQNLARIFMYKNAMEIIMIPQ